MFTTEERDYVRERVLDLARSDPRVTAGALTGSTAVGTEDEWSDIDVAFGIADGASLEAVLDDWSEVLGREFGALHHWDLTSGSSIYRVFLLPTGLEVDVGVFPQNDFGARGPRFRTLFGTPRQLEPWPQPDAQHLVGLGWHHVLHARSSIERGKPWGAEYWISAIRDYTLTLACLRMGEEAAYARGVHRLPATVTEPLAGALVRSLDEEELRRALGVATASFISEVEALDPALCARLKPLLQEFGAPQYPRE
jgi:predicted nucleotidyltransferase